MHLLLLYYKLPWNSDQKCSISRDIRWNVRNSRSILREFTVWCDINWLCCYCTPGKVLYCFVHCQSVLYFWDCTRLINWNLPYVAENCVSMVTGRNEVVAKVIFLHLSVILFTGGGVSASVHAGIPHTPWSRHPPEQTHPRGADTPQEQIPPREQTRPPPPREQTHGQWAAGTHPTGMHSCLVSFSGFA